MNPDLVPVVIYAALTIMVVCTLALSHIMADGPVFTRAAFADLGQAIARPLRMLAERAAHKKSGLASLRREIAEVYRQIKRDHTLILDDLGRGVHGMRPGADCLACLGAGTTCPCTCSLECGSTDCARRSA